jgi:hypothetical protein
MQATSVSSALVSQLRHKTKSLQEEIMNRIETTQPTGQRRGHQRRGQLMRCRRRILLTVPCRCPASLLPQLPDGDRINDASHPPVRRRRGPARAAEGAKQSVTKQTPMYNIYSASGLARTKRLPSGGRSKEINKSVISQRGFRRLWGRGRQRSFPFSNRSSGNWKQAGLVNYVHPGFFRRMQPLLPSKLMMTSLCGQQHVSTFRA